MASLDQTQISGRGEQLEGHRKSLGGKWLVVGGYVAALISPIIGLMIGLIMLIDRPRRTGQGIAVIIISVAVFAGAYVASTEHVVTVQHPKTALQSEPDKFIACVNNQLSDAGSVWRVCNKLLGR